MNNQRMRRTGVLTIVVGILLIGALVSPAGAEGQVIDATIGSSVSMSSDPTAAISGWSLAPTGANTTSGGSMSVQANVAYTVTLAADKAAMTEYDTVAGDYVASSPKTLGTSLSLVPALTSGTGVPVASLSVGTSAGTIATGVGLGTDAYSLTLSQPTLLTDEPLASGRTYHIELTYTAAAAL